MNKNSFPFLQTRSFYKTVECCDEHDSNSSALDPGKILWLVDYVFLTTLDMWSEAWVEENDNLIA